MLLKNLCFDLGFLNPLKKKRDPNTERQAVQTPKQPIMEKQEEKKQLLSANQSLPHVSKKLLKEYVQSGKPAQIDGKPSYLLPKIKSDVEQPAKIQLKNALTKPESKSISSPSVSNTALSNTFFMKLQDHIKKEDSLMNGAIPKQILYHDLLEEMQGFWQNQKFDIHKNMLDSAIKADVAKKVRDLHDLEVEWQKLQNEDDRIKDELATKELIIENHVKQLKRSFKKMHLSLDAPSDKHFLLRDGTRIKNLQELSDQLRMMGDSTFYFHVNNQKNDFANWVKNVMSLSDLAGSMAKAGNRQQMMNCIENWHNSF